MRRSAKRGRQHKAGKDAAAVKLADVAPEEQSAAALGNGFLCEVSSPVKPSCQEKAAGPQELIVDLPDGHVKVQFRGVYRVARDWEANGAPVWVHECGKGWLYLGSNDIWHLTRDRGEVGGTRGHIISSGRAHDRNPSEMPKWKSNSGPDKEWVVDTSITVGNAAEREESIPGSPRSVASDGSEAIEDLMEGDIGVAASRPIPLRHLAQYRFVSWRWKDSDGMVHYPIPIGMSRPLSPFSSSGSEHSDA